MKSVAIISRHAISNYGSLLQAYALEKVIRDLGYDASTIDYILTEEKSWHLCRIDIANSAWNSDPLRRMVFYTINIPNRAIQFSKFSKFRKELLHLTKEYSSIKELKTSPPTVDLYCTGSDQVWNETIHDKLDWCYFLDFLDKQKRIAYAASFGKDTVKNEVQARVKVALSKYSKISVRETSGIDILTNLNLTGDVVLDPTLLLNHADWDDVIGNAISSNEKYVLLYQIHKNEKLVEYAKNYAKKVGCKVINISVSYTQRKEGIVFKWLPNYKEVLALLRDAYCVVTDSFHATAFSINFNKQFVTILPKLSASRIRSFLSLMKLENRVLSDTTNYELPDDKIDYSDVNLKLEALRKESIAWLDTAIKENIGEL